MIPNELLPKCLNCCVTSHSSLCLSKVNQTDFHEHLQAFIVLCFDFITVYGTA